MFPYQLGRGQNFENMLMIICVIHSAGEVVGKKKITLIHCSLELKLVQVFFFFFSFKQLGNIFQNLCLVFFVPKISLECF